MSLTSWMVIIFTLLIWGPYAFSLNFDVSNEVYICRTVRRNRPKFRADVPIKKTNLKCLVVSNIGQAGSRSREYHWVFTKLPNSTQHCVHLTGGNCNMSRTDGIKLQCQCIFQNDEQRKPRNCFGRGSRTIFRKFTKRSLQVEYILHLINSTKLVRNAILRRRVNIFYGKAVKKLTKINTYSSVLICTKHSVVKGGDAQLRSRDGIFREAKLREKRDVFGNLNFSSSTAFSSYFSSITITSRSISSITPSVTPSSRSPSEVCPRSVVVNRSTIFVTPTTMRTRYTPVSLVATSKLTAVTDFTVFIRNNSTTPLPKTSNVTSIPAFTLNATASSLIIAHLQHAKNSTVIYNKDLVSVIFTAQDFAIISQLGCATVAQLLPTQPPPAKTAPTLYTKPTEESKPEKTKLYLGLIAGGGVILAIVICVALFLLVRRYRRIKALRRKAKQISYFNRFDCSSAWDEPDRFGGSKLSVFTLKNSKFDIDWDSSHETK